MGNVGKQMLRHALSHCSSRQTKSKVFPHWLCICIGANLVSEYDSFYSVKEKKNNTCESHPLSTPCTSHEYFSKPQTPSHHSSSSSGAPSPPPRVPSISATRERGRPPRFLFLTLGIYVHDFFSCFFFFTHDPSCPSACLSSLHALPGWRFRRAAKLSLCSLLHEIKEEEKKAEMKKESSVYVC